MVLSGGLGQHMSLLTSSLSGLGIGFIYIFPLSSPLPFLFLDFFSLLFSPQ